MKLTPSFGLERLHRLGIGGRLFTGGGVLVLLLVALGLFSAHRLQNFAARFVDVLDSRIPSMTLVHDVMGDLNRAGFSARDAILSAEADRDRQLKLLDESRSRIGAKIEALQKQMGGKLPDFPGVPGGKLPSLPGLGGKLPGLPGLGLPFGGKKK